MKIYRDHWPGIGLCLVIALASYYLGRVLPVVGAPVLAMLIGLGIGTKLDPASLVRPGTRLVAKKVLQLAVVLLGFGLNLGVVFETGKQSLPIILATILTALLIAYLVAKWLGIPGRVATLVGVGSSICGGSAIAATAPVIAADDEEVAQAISVIFFFNVLAAVVFPLLGRWLGLQSVTGESFGIFAGTAINDTSSVTAAASTWDSLYDLGSQTLDKAVTVKLTRTLAIIPITMGLAYLEMNRHPKEGQAVKRAPFPTFILYFIGASFLTTLAPALGLPVVYLASLKGLSKGLIILAMAAIGLNSDVSLLLKTGRKPLLLGFLCWGGITLVSLTLQWFLGIW